MMYNYPYFSFPHFRRYTNYYSPVQYPYNNQIARANFQNYNQGQQQNHNLNLNQEQVQEQKRSSSKRTPSGFSFLNNILHQEDRGDDEEYFELLGLKLYNDDLLLIGLIFFLYKEDVKDQYLFFALILLLLS